MANDLLFPFYVFRIDGGVAGSYFSTGVNPTAGYAALVDDSDPPELEAVTLFGSVRWFAPGSNTCPGGGMEDSEIGGATDSEHGMELLDTDGLRLWERGVLLVQLRSDLALPPLTPARHLGIGSFDSLGAALGASSIQRVVSLPDDLCNQYPVSSRILRVRFAMDIDELGVASLYEQLPEVVFAHPNYAIVPEYYDEHLDKQWPLRITGATSCLDADWPEWTCDPSSDIGMAEAWQTNTHGNPAVKVAFFDSGADMQHPDLLRAYAVNPGEDITGDGTADLCPAPSGDLNGEDDDGNNVVDDVMLGYAILYGGAKDWVHYHQTDPHGHGTSVASLLGAITGNDLGIASPAGGQYPADGIKLIQFSNRTFVVEVSDQIDMLAYAAAYGAQVFTTSAGLQNWPAIYETVRELSSTMTFIAAVGNDNRNTFENGFARIPEVMAVGGYDCQYGGRWVIPSDWQDDVPLWKGSDYGPGLSLLGPANDDFPYAQGYPRMVMASLFPTTPADAGSPPAYDCTSQWADADTCFGGTSASAPIVAAVAALVRSYMYDHSIMPPFPQPVRRILEHTAEDVLCDPSLVAEGCPCDSPEAHCAIDYLGWDEYSGYGRVDAGRALTLPICVLDSLQLPESQVVFRGDRLQISWSAFDLNTDNGDLFGQGAHFELHCLVPEQPGSPWITINGALAPNTTSYEWEIPYDFPTGDNRRIRLTVCDSGTPPHTNLDYSLERFMVRDPVASAESIDDVPLVSLQVTPNPGSRSVTITYGLRTAAPVVMEVFDVSGRLVRNLQGGLRQAGSHRVPWDRRDGAGRVVDSGVYFVRLSAGGNVRIGRLVLAE